MALDTSEGSASMACLTASHELSPVKAAKSVPIKIEGRIEALYYDLLYNIVTI